MTETERAEWNAALAAGDPERIAALQRQHLDAINRRIMDNDPRSAAAGWTPEPTCWRCGKPEHQCRGFCGAFHDRDDDDREALRAAVEGVVS